MDPRPGVCWMDPADGLRCMAADLWWDGADPFVARDGGFLRYMATGELVVNGNRFGTSAEGLPELLVSLEYSGDRGTRDVEVCEGGLVLLHTKPDSTMLDEASAREVCAKVQKMRKEAGLRKTDEVDVFYKCTGGAAESVLSKVLTAQHEYDHAQGGLILSIRLGLARLYFPWPWQDAWTTFGTPTSSGTSQAASVGRSFQ